MSQTLVSNRITRAIEAIKRKVNYNKADDCDFLSVQGSGFNGIFWTPMLVSKIYTFINENFQSGLYLQHVTEQADIVLLQEIQAASEPAFYIFENWAEVSVRFGFQHNLEIIGFSNWIKNNCVPTAIVNNEQLAGIKDVIFDELITAMSSGDYTTLRERDGIAVQIDGRSNIFKFGDYIAIKSGDQIPIPAAWSESGQPTKIAQGVLRLLLACFAYRDYSEMHITRRDGSIKYTKNMVFTDVRDELKTQHQLVRHVANIISATGTKINGKSLEETLGAWNSSLEDFKDWMKSEIDEDNPTVPTRDIKEALHANFRLQEDKKLSNELLNEVRGFPYGIQYKDLNCSQFHTYLCNYGSDKIKDSGGCFTEIGTQFPEIENIVIDAVNANKVTINFRDGSIRSLGDVRNSVRMVNGSGDDKFISWKMVPATYAGDTDIVRQGPYATAALGMISSAHVSEVADPSGQGQPALQISIKLANDSEHTVSFAIEDNALVATLSPVANESFFNVANKIINEIEHNINLENHKVENAFKITALNLIDEINEAEMIRSLPGNALQMTRSLPGRGTGSAGRSSRSTRNASRRQRRGLAVKYGPGGECSSINNITPSIQITNAWLWICQFLPSDARITSGIRTTAEQEDLIVRKANEYGIDFDETAPNYRLLTARLRLKGYIIAYPSPHRHGRAFDVAGNNLSNIAAIVEALSSETLIDFKAGQILVEPVNGAVHIQIRRVGSVTQSKIDELKERIAQSNVSEHVENNHVFFRHAAEQLVNEINEAGTRSLPGNELKMTRGLRGRGAGTDTSASRAGGVNTRDSSTPSGSLSCGLSRGYNDGDLKNVNSLSVSDAGIQELKRSEGSRARVYDDANGRVISSYDDAAGDPTIGIGHLIDPNEQSEFENNLGGDSGQDMTDVEITRLFRRDVEEHLSWKNSIRVPITQNMFDALASFAFNVGNAGPARYGIINLINQEKYDEAAEKLCKSATSGAGGRVNLQTRRNAEARKFLA